jgi:hypothetical protein
MIRFCLIGFFVSLFVSLSAQSDETEFFRNPEKNERFDAGVPIFSGIVLPLYSPEMEFSFGATGVMTFKTRRNNPDLWHSVFPVYFSINPEGSFIIKVRHTSFWHDNLIMFDVDADYRKMTDNYWGTGMENADNVKKGKTTTEYQRKSYYLRPSVLLRVFNEFYIGLLTDINQTTVHDPAALMLEDPEVLNFGMDIFSAGLGVVALFDTRDKYLPSSSGMYIKAGGTMYSGILGSDYQFQQITVDYRHVLPIIRKGSLLALQLKTIWCIGDVPWSVMPQLGGPDDLRGYYQGQYRDKDAMIIQAEYRHFFMHIGDETLSRHGLIYWLGGGTVFRDIGKIKRVVLSTGIGYRYRFQPNICLRVDVGFGTENVGIYLGLNEGF